MLRLRGGRLAALAAACAVVMLGSGCARDQSKAKPPGPDFGQRIIQADTEPQNWLSNGRNYQETHHSPLSLINTRNIGQLGLAWSYDLDTRRGQESTPLVVDGVIYTTSAWSKVQAFDGVTGKLLWQFDPQVPPSAGEKVCCDVVNRGAAYWNGKVYVGTVDGRLIAVDARTGRQVWSVMTVEPTDHRSITGAPRVVKGRVIIGNAGGEYASRGYVSAYDAENGKLAWRFFIVPGDPARRDGAASDKPLEMVRATWASDTWKDGGGGGGNPWNGLAYDPELNLLYVGTANAAFWSKGARSKDLEAAGGDNLFTASVLALRPETGEYVWHYQETPNDQWDYDSANQMILTDLTIGGQLRKVLLHAPKNGFFYVLDRATGKLISAKPFAKVTWASRVDLATGRPVVNPEADYSRTGKLWVGYPSSNGAHGWQAMSFDAKRGLVFIPALDVAGPYQADKAFKPLPKGVNVGLDFDAFHSPEDPKAIAAAKAGMQGFLLAWDPVAQKEVWRVRNPDYWNGGVLSTDGGLVFQGELGGAFNAYDSATGRKLWAFDAQTAVLAAPVAWARDGVQYVTVVVGYGGAPAMGGGTLSWDDKGPRRNISRVLTFALGKTGRLPQPPPLPRKEPVKTAQFADAAVIALGRSRYQRTCFACHGFEGVSGGLVTDLRYSYAIADKDAFKSIVYDGALESQGMISFKPNFSLEEIEAIRAYLIERAKTAPVIGGH